MGIGTLFNPRKGRPRGNIYAIGEQLNQRLSRFHMAILDFYCGEVEPGVGRRQVLETMIDNYLVPKILQSTDYSEDMLRETLQGAIRQRLREMGELGDTPVTEVRPEAPAEAEPDPEAPSPTLRLSFANVTQALNWRRYGHEAAGLPCWDQDNPVDHTILSDDEWAWAAWQMCQEGRSVLEEEWPEATIMRALCQYEASAFDGDLSAIKPRYRDKAVELEAYAVEDFEPELEG